ncbi:hypothetical protein SAMN05428997_11817 [Bosea sp. CRIB-10]|uniref:hypothetical protein n=1 Tax=Bosea sp. CRIB-10 TaxID=378404 RepID=UPI0008E08207|nr:hypothetical protein [Bosea sp. CRIB-10]SFD11614.1 hypothetical protein SAMN05428997_11817 [Bosea sp. CRIB-10]
MKTLISAAGMLGLALITIPVEANAVVCARGVVRAGCAGPNGAVVARRPVPGAVVVRPAPRAVVVRPAPVRCAIVNGRRVCR